MKVNRKSWHARVYAWWWAAKHDSNANEVLYNIKPTNLCPYVRAILFWAPLSFLLHPSRSHFAKFFWGVILAAFEAVLVHFNGWRKTLIAELQFIAFIAGFLSVIFGAIGIIAAVKKVKKTEVMQSFSEVLEARYEAAHSKICPTIELV